MSSWMQCHAQPTLLFLHLALHAAPLAAKLRRVWSKIKRAETRKLQLWDRKAHRIAFFQLVALSGVVFGQWIVAAEDYETAQLEARSDCIDSRNPVQVPPAPVCTSPCFVPARVVRADFHTIRLALPRASPTRRFRSPSRAPPPRPFPPSRLFFYTYTPHAGGRALHAHGSGHPHITHARELGRHRHVCGLLLGIFPAWPLLTSLFATILATCLYAESFFTGEYYVVALGARFLGVQTLGLVMLWAWLLPATSKWLRCCRRKKLSEAILADVALQPSQRAHLQRQLQLQEYMASLMAERLLEHQHRLSTLRLRLTLLNTPRQAGFLRARNALDGPFDTYWAELRRDKKVYFFAHVAAAPCRSSPSNSRE